MNNIVEPGMMVYDVDKKVVGWVTDNIEECINCRVWTIEWSGNRYSAWAEGSVVKANRDFNNLAKQNGKR